MFCILTLVMKPVPDAGPALIPVSNPVNVPSRTMMALFVGLLIEMPVASTLGPG
jgi:hypothetical protein